MNEKAPEATRSSTFEIASFDVSREGNGWVGRYRGRLTDEARAHGCTDLIHAPTFKELEIEAMVIRIAAEWYRCDNRAHGLHLSARQPGCESLAWGPPSASEVKILDSTCPCTQPHYFLCTVLASASFIVIRRVEDGHMAESRQMLLKHAVATWDHLLSGFKR